ncbi:MAG: ESX-1 secretion-associated protein [Actinomycetia bacterium]|nr:ESX-1 secretion-associated protein [Actinomycetes bacterium]MCH9702302.1 ESX-1 secretion-associated protein [Actinomycetes bacterium]MCH9761454.1 ESX-1 secretion-associated protein [Actinomycetes bacterium]
MGQADAARVDLGALRAIAREYETAAMIVDGAARTHLGDPAFGGACAGRSYVGHGIALRAALDDVAASLRLWSRAASEIAVDLRSSADRYQEADARAAGRMG